MNEETIAETVEFLMDTETGATFTVDRAEPDPDFVDKLIAEAARMRKEYAETHKIILERLFRVSQMWMGGAALLAASGLFAGARSAWWPAAFYVAGFVLSLYGQRARKGAPLGVHPEAFNEWARLRASTPRNLETLLSTWQIILDQAHDEIAWRARWLNINLGAMGGVTLLIVVWRALP